MAHIQEPPRTKGQYDVVIIGAGVLGLSIAQELLHVGLKIAIVARDLPEDLHSTAFASPWAGANWASYATNEDERRRDTITFERFAKLSERYPDLVQKMPFVYVWNEEGSYEEQWYKDLVYNYRPLGTHEVPTGWKNAVGFTAFTLNTPAYLAHLASTLRLHGVPIIRHRLASLDEAYTILGPTSLVINCTGLGARSLLGVQDPKVFPIRGQTVLVKAPKVGTNYGIKDRNRQPASGFQAYIIPRPGPEGYVVLGGTSQKREWDTNVNVETAERILRESYDLCPDLGDGKGWENIHVISHNVGLRPAREGGMRLELEERTLGQGVEKGLMPWRGKTIQHGSKVGVVHAYGIGPAGYQASLGTAEEAAGLAVGYLKKHQRAKL